MDHPNPTEKENDVSEEYVKLNAELDIILEKIKLRQQRKEYAAPKTTY